MEETARGGSGRERRSPAWRWSLPLFGALLASLLILSAPSDARKLKGTPDDDKIIGTPERDRIAGRAGDDKLKGRAGHDKIRGGAGNDKLVGGESSDDLGGGTGDDKLKAIDGRPDKRVSGGKGDDLCIGDLRDANRMQGCESVRLKGETGGGGGGGGGDEDGGDGAAGTRLTITDPESDCPAGGPPGLLCQFSVTGAGADESFGSASVTSGDQTTGGGPVQAEDDGTYSGQGPFGCPADAEGQVTLTVEIGDETASTPLPCTETDGDGPAPPDGEPPAPPDDDPPDNGRVTITSVTNPPCEQGDPGFGFVCEFTATGTGADAPGGSATVTSDNDSIGGGVVDGRAGDGTFTVEQGNYGCQAGSTPMLTVQIGGEESDSLPLRCDDG